MMNRNSNGKGEKRLLPVEIDRMKNRMLVKRLKQRMVSSVENILTNKLIGGVVDAGIAWLKSEVLYVVSIDNELGRLEDALFRYFANYEETIEINALNDLEPVMYNKHYYWNHMEQYFRCIRWNGVMIALIVGNNDGVELPGERPVVKLMTLNTDECKRGLKQFIHHLYLESMQMIDKRIYLHGRIKVIRDRNDVLMMNNKKLRSFDDVFIPDSLRKQIMEPIMKYINNYEFYENTNIPNHFGVLLYGAPSTGKSSIAQAIANEINALYWVMSGDLIEDIHEIVYNQVWLDPPAKNKYRVLCIEDIDSGIANMNARKKRYHGDAVGHDNEPVGLATILNTLDGVGSPTNIVYVMTTNHKEILDPALIRPGRCDVCVEIPYVCAETLIEFMDRYYPDHGYTVNDIGDIKPNISFAQLQTRLMMNDTAEQIVKYCRV